MLGKGEIKMRDLVDDYEATGEPNLSTVAGCANSRYTATVRGGRIDMIAPELPLELNQMIVWIMHSQDAAAYLLPAYRELRQQTEKRTRPMNQEDEPEYDEEPETEYCMENSRLQETIGERIDRLKRFYGVSTINELIVEQEKHVEKLQEKCRRGLRQDVLPHRAHPSPDHAFRPPAVPPSRSDL
ncbi:MAG TPA: hypothetical protein VLB84_02865, partial [Bacteroidia bacterium]|nr:hypothetical protein [Bacteroidia bacterium]